MKGTYHKKRTQVIFDKIPKAIGSPVVAARWAWRRLFPYGIKPKDPEAYRIGSWSYGNAPRKPLTAIFPGIEKTSITILEAHERDEFNTVTVTEAAALAAIVRFKNAKRILEIGTFDGKTAILLAANTAQSAKVFTVDLPPKRPDKYALSFPSLYENSTAPEIVGAEFKTHPEFKTRIQQVFGDSATIDFSKLGGMFDVAFIDGNHHTTYVKSDTDNVLSVLAPNGCILWHDYGMSDDVSAIVDTYRDVLDISIVQGTRIAVGQRKASANKAIRK